MYIDKWPCWEILKEGDYLEDTGVDVKNIN